MDLGVRLPNFERLGDVEVGIETFDLLVDVFNCSGQLHLVAALGDDASVGHGHDGVPPWHPGCHQSLVEELVCICDAE